MGLMDRAKQDAGSFKKPDISGFIPAEAKDAVERVVAAGLKLMYSSEMRDEVMREVRSQEPTPQKLAAAVTGLVLMLDQKSQGGIPEQAIFPAAMELLGEAAAVLVQAGQPVTQEDFNTAAMLMFVQIGRKLGASDEQMMQAAQGAVPQGPDDRAAEPGGEPQAMPGGMQGGM